MLSVGLSSLFNQPALSFLIMERRMSNAPADRPYLVDNNPQLDHLALERRLGEIIAEQPVLPIPRDSLPSRRPPYRATILRSLLARLKSSRLVSEWLPRHARLYRLARTLYHTLRRLTVR